MMRRSRTLRSPHVSCNAPLGVGSLNGGASCCGVVTAYGLPD